MPRKIKKSSESKKNVQKKLSNPNEPLANVPLENSPSVSIIMPMYNVEDYIEEALNSILWQTFKDFEIIIVDDCSDDDSVKIAESYIQRFGGRLNLIKLETNHGYGSIPRNEGLKVARGEYVFFMDSDDVISEDALEKLYTDAKKTDAEVVVCKKRFASSGVGENFVKEATLDGDPNDNTIDLVADDMNVRLEAFMKNMIPLATWRKLIRRDFLIDNDIKFLPIMQEDSVWTFELICLAKTIIMVPYVIYIYRKRPNSVCNVAYDKKLDPKGIYQKFNRIINGLKHIDDFMGKIEFFQNNPDWRYKLIEHTVSQNLTWLKNMYGMFPTQSIYENAKEAFKNETGDLNVLIAYFISSSIQMYKLLYEDK